MTIKVFTKPKGRIICHYCKNDKSYEEMVPSKVYKAGIKKHCLLCDEKYFQSAYSKRLKNIKRYKAALIIANMRHRGEYHPKPCVKCGSDKNVEGHHEDYDKPKELTWLCKVCHLEHHKLINVKGMR